MTLLEDVNDFYAKWYQRDEYGDHAQRTVSMEWIKRYREAGYPEFVMHIPLTQLEELVDEVRSTTIRCVVVCHLGNRHFFFNTEKDKVLFILKWS